MIKSIIFLTVWGFGCACLDQFKLVKHPAWFYVLGAFGMAISSLFVY